MKNKIFRRILCIALTAGLLLSSVSCGKKDGGTDVSSEVQKEENTEDTGKKPASLFSSDGDDDNGKTSGASSKTGSVFVRPALFDVSLITYDSDNIKASVPEYKVQNDLSNVMNADQIYLEDSWKDHLVKDGFFVTDGGSGEFFEIYESNRYSMTPSFVTVDSLMHSYHLYFAYLLKKTEKNRLMDELKKLTDKMLELSIEQKVQMELSSKQDPGTGEWDTAADRNIAFFAVGRSLLDPSYDAAKDEGIDKETLEIVKEELSLIDSASGITTSPLSGDSMQMEDYSQYKPRGYYDTDENLRQYFKAMMWFGRMNFAQKEESLDRSAMLLSVCMDDEAYELWSSIYAVTSFFAGASDDNGIPEYRPLVKEAYGMEVKELTGDKLLNEEAFSKFHELTGKLDPPAINSVPMMDDEGKTEKTEENKGFRFMGQRFSIDASVFQKLIYSSVKENKSGGTRMLPDALDIPAALGSRTAEDILRNDLKAMEYEGYEENLKELQDTIKSSSDETWYSSLYSEWLNTLRPLLEEKGAGYPVFMQNTNWNKRSVEGFLGSYTELKHDTVLYSKQVIAEMGGGDEEVVDFRGYVEPEPAVYERFKSLAEGTSKGLEKFGMLDGDSSENLKKLSDLASKLYDISIKELKDEPLTDEEYELIEIYGGEIEHFWYEAYKEEAEEANSYLDSRMFPPPVVVDVATDPNGSVLELGTGKPSNIYVVVPVDGTLRIARGSVFDFYQFTKPLNERLTDHEWRVMLGIDPDDDGEYHWEQETPDKPAWTLDYRVHYGSY